MNMRTKITLFAISMLIIATSGCVNNSTEPVVPIPTQTEDVRIDTSDTPTETSTTPIDTSEDIQIYNIGQNVSDNNTKMTLNNIIYTKIIDEGKNISNADTGKKFLIMNITIENIGKDKNISYPGSQFIILDTDEDIETIYEEDSGASLNLRKYFNGEDILPGTERKGELVFQVPENAKGLNLRFEFSPDSSDELKLEFFNLDK